MYKRQPLGDLINKSLRGEAAVRESWLVVYVKRLTDGDKGKLRQALKVVDAAIIMWKSKYFKMCIRDSSMAE